MRIVTTSLLLLLHGTFSFLGHGGLHALEGSDGCSHHHHAHTGDAAHHHEAGCHTLSHSCCHRHGQPADEPEPNHPEPTPHDHDNCLICQWHAQHHGSVTAPVSEEIAAPALDLLTFESLAPSNQAVDAIRSRGPPTVC